MVVRKRQFVQDLDAHPPTKVEYLFALREVWPKRKDVQADLNMLRLQAEYGGRITSTEMCYALNYPDILQVNGRYGRLGHAIADALSIDSRTGGQWYLAISRNGGFRGQGEGAGRFVWEMRPQFEAALRAYEPTARIFEQATQLLPVSAQEAPPAPEVISAIAADFATAGLEGDEREAAVIRRTRAAWLAETFVRSRLAAGKLKCDDCGFDAQAKAISVGVAPRSLLDVHHLHPLAEGSRLNTINDFRLLCPTCHRVAHALLDRDR
jgi:predicted HNH restriction endonuclease